MELSVRLWHHIIICLPTPATKTIRDLTVHHVDLTKCDDDDRLLEDLHEMLSRTRGHAQVAAHWNQWAQGFTPLNSHLNSQENSPGLAFLWSTALEPNRAFTLLDGRAFTSVATVSIPSVHRFYVTCCPPFLPPSSSVSTNTLVLLSAFRESGIFCPSSLDCGLVQTHG